MQQGHSTEATFNERVAEESKTPSASSPIVDFQDSVNEAINTWDNGKREKDTSAIIRARELFSDAIRAFVPTNTPGKKNQHIPWLACVHLGYARCQIEIKKSEGVYDHLLAAHRIFKDDHTHAYPQIFKTRYLLAFEEFERGNFTESLKLILAAKEINEKIAPAHRHKVKIAKLENLQKTINDKPFNYDKNIEQLVKTNALTDQNEIELVGKLKNNPGDIQNLRDLMCFYAAKALRSNPKLVFSNERIDSITNYLFKLEIGYLKNKKQFGFEQLKPKTLVSIDTFKNIIKDSIELICDEKLPIQAVKTRIANKITGVTEIKTEVKAELKSEEKLEPIQALRKEIAGYSFLVPNELIQLASQIHRLRRNIVVLGNSHPTQQLAAAKKALDEASVMKRWFLQTSNRMAENRVVLKDKAESKECFIGLQDLKTTYAHFCKRKVEDLDKIKSQLAKLQKINEEITPLLKKLSYDSSKGLHFFARPLLPEKAASNRYSGRNKQSRSKTNSSQKRLSFS